jgi:hypothetical protein
MDLCPSRGAKKDEPLQSLHRYYDVSDVEATDYQRRFPDGNTVANDDITVFRRGIRYSLFGVSPLLTKHPLTFLDDKIEPICHNEHRVGNAHVADITCLLFHYKFIEEFHEYAALAAQEENYAYASSDYKKYLEVLEQEPNLHIKRDTAREFQSTDELIDSGFLVVSEEYLDWVKEVEKEKDSLRLHDKPHELAETLLEVRAEGRIKSLRLQHSNAKLRKSVSTLQSLEQQILSQGNTIETRKRQIVDKDKRIETLRLRNQALSQALESQKHKVQNSRIRKLVRLLDAIKGKISHRP